jgi:threonine dehydrogenase-like Zn-dependent dehydrogenase
MRDIPDPQMRPAEVAVKVVRAGLCGTETESDSADSTWYSAMNP